jgi:molybdenum-dependent DNA-binding transcriptional regulator ModE
VKKVTLCQISFRPNWVIIDIYKALVRRGIFGMHAKSASYVLAIYETGSFTKAAERLGIKQPSLSSLIKRLENELGLQLFERDQRTPVRMTPAGRALVPQLRRFARSADALKTKASRIAPNPICVNDRDPLPSATEPRRGASGRPRISDPHEPMPRQAGSSMSRQ